jgi:hypothetical protein
MENCLQNARAYSSVAEYAKWCEDNKKEVYQIEKLEKLKGLPSAQCHTKNSDEKCAAVGAKHRVCIFIHYYTFL